MNIFAKTLQEKLPPTFETKASKCISAFLTISPYHQVRERLVLTFFSDHPHVLDSLSSSLWSHHSHSPFPLFLSPKPVDMLNILTIRISFKKFKW